MAYTLPMRFRILHIISTHKDINRQQLIDALKPEYGNEGQLNDSLVETHLASMRAVGMIEDTDISIDASNNLIQRFKITEYGHSRLAYLPKSWSQAHS
jgi:hypothetical protein